MPPTNKNNVHPTFIELTFKNPYKMFIVCINLLLEMSYIMLSNAISKEWCNEGFVELAKVKISTLLVKWVYFLLSDDDHCVLHCVFSDTWFLKLQNEPYFKSYHVSVAGWKINLAVGGRISLKKANCPCSGKWSPRVNNSWTFTISNMDSHILYCYLTNSL